jgi:hypothetical protein
MPSIGAAVRAFGDLANDKQSAVAKHPSDYILFQVGEFNDAAASFSSLAAPRNLGLASDFILVDVARSVSAAPGQVTQVSAADVFPSAQSDDDPVRTAHLRVLADEHA